MIFKERKIPRVIIDYKSLPHLRSFDKMRQFMIFQSCHNGTIGKNQLAKTNFWQKLAKKLAKTNLCGMHKL